MSYALGYKLHTDIFLYIQVCTALFCEASLVWYKWLPLCRLFRSGLWPTYTCFNCAIPCYLERHCPDLNQGSPVYKTGALTAKPQRHIRRKTLQWEGAAKCTWINSSAYASLLLKMKWLYKYAVKCSVWASGLATAWLNGWSICVVHRRSPVQPLAVPSFLIQTVIGKSHFVK